MNANPAYSPLALLFPMQHDHKIYTIHWRLNMYRRPQCQLPPSRMYHAQTHVSPTGLPQLYRTPTPHYNLAPNLCSRNWSYWHMRTPFLYHPRPLSTSFSSVIVYCLLPFRLRMTSNWTSSTYAVNLLHYFTILIPNPDSPKWSLYLFIFAMGAPMERELISLSDWLLLAMTSLIWVGSCMPCWWRLAW